LAGSFGMFSLDPKYRYNKQAYNIIKRLSTARAR